MLKAGRVFRNSGLRGPESYFMVGYYRSSVCVTRELGSYLIKVLLINCLINNRVWNGVTYSVICSFRQYYCVDKHLVTKGGYRKSEIVRPSGASYVQQLQCCLKRLRFQNYGCVQKRSAVQLSVQIDLYVLST
jgi:hypothetical protein